MSYTVPPAPGDTFAVPGRRDPLVVAQLIASFTAEPAQESLYLVQSRAGARWILAANLSADGPRWEGRAVPAETTEL